MVTTLIPVLAASGLTGCAYNSAQQQAGSACQAIGPKALLGGLGGAAGGAAIGGLAGRGRGAAIGAGVGLLAGAIAGHLADQQDCAAAQAVLQAQLFAARPNTRIAWRSESGHEGEYVAVGSPYQVAGNTCRRADSVPNPGETAVPLISCRTPGGDYTYSRA